MKRIPVPETIGEEEPEYNYPPIDLLAEAETEDVASHRQGDMEKAKLLEETLQKLWHCFPALTASPMALRSRDLNCSLRRA